MKKVQWLPLLVLLLSLSSCEVVKGIYDFGFWSGVIIVLVIIGLILFVVRKLF